MAYYRTSESEIPLGVINIGRFAIFSLNGTDFGVRSNPRTREYWFRSINSSAEEAVDWLFALRASVSFDGRGSLVRRALSGTSGFSELEDDETPPGSNQLCREACKILSEGHKMKDGWLGKRTNVGVGYMWPKRFFVLIPEGAIYYFRSPISLGKWKDPMGAMSVVGATIEKEGQKPFSIAIRCPEGQLLVSAEDEDDRETWITALKAAAEAHSTPAH